MATFLVGSTFMRVGYSVTKTTTFCGLALAQALGGLGGGSSPVGLVDTMLTAFQVTAWMAVMFCLLRGVPVVVHGFRHRRPLPHQRIGDRILDT